MTKAEELLALADRVKNGPPSRDLDLACEKALRGMMANQTYPRRYSSIEWAPGTVEMLENRAAVIA